MTHIKASALRRGFFLIHKGVKSLCKNGVSATLEKVRSYYRFRVKQPDYSGKDLKTQRETQFSREIKFSIIVPLYNTPKTYLCEMIRSVQEQTYSNWELCLADGSTTQYSYIGSICGEFAKTDSRIRYQKLEENLGISGNTNVGISMATGDYLALLDHDDCLHPSALYEMMRAICEKNADFIYTDENTFHDNPKDAFLPHFKPDFAPDTLRSYNYICHFCAFKRELLNAAGLFRSAFDGSQDYDLILRLTEKARNIVHIPRVLYYWRAHASSVAQSIDAKPYVPDAGKRALQEHLHRVGIDGEVADAALPTTYRVQYTMKGEPLISILIPNKDHVPDLKKCLDSLMMKTTYRNWEVLVIENNSTERETFDYYAEIEKESGIRVITWKGEFNYAAINNFGARYARGEYLLLLNNDIEVITPDWLEQMLMFAQRQDVGGVGAMLYYPDNTIQHAGVIVGLNGVAGHSHKNYPRGSRGYMGRLSITQNYSAVTAACMMIRKSVWDEVNGLDEAFAVTFNDVDLCMRIRKAGYLIVWTPYAELYHHESRSRGSDDTPEKSKRFQKEILLFKTRWKAELSEGDPYYNPNLSLGSEDFAIRGAKRTAGNRSNA